MLSLYKSFDFHSRIIITPVRNMKQFSKVEMMDSNDSAEILIKDFKYMKLHLGCKSHFVESQIEEQSFNVILMNFTNVIMDQMGKVSYKMQNLNIKTVIFTK